LKPVIKRSFFHILLPLSAGVFVYIALRKPETLLHRFTGIRSPLISLPDAPISNFLLFHFPDMCWAYALTATLLLIVRLSPAGSATISILFLSAFELVQAGGQLARLDWRDCGWMTLASISAALMIKK
jgi:hypothetical protein